MPELPDLNPVIHGKLRLALLSLLAGVEEADFTWLRAKTGSTDGNLGAQLRKLEEAGLFEGQEAFRPAQTADALSHDRRKPRRLGGVCAGPQGAAGHGHIHRLSA